MIKFTVSRDNRVLVDGEVVGHVYGEPRRWAYYALYPTTSKQDFLNGWLHAKRDAAKECVIAFERWRATQSTEPEL
ncbi:hypothetical protein GCM10009569_03780 [Arthrobacter russicus]|uniref:Uncharacterized protein n=1 Tax=Arthrobacter russicus TaxID=172040 RepID=A0ABU1JDV0_9MICC|nr:hypothetical protein [Arthrobacter russicus]